MRSMASCYAEQLDPSIRGLLRLHEAQVHDVIAHPDWRVPVFASADVTGAQNIL